MPYLLDTSVFLAAALAPDRLTPRAQRLLSSGSAPLFLSAASAWEIAIKYALGKLEIPDIPARWVSASLLKLDAHPLDITQRHALAVAALPYPHHDPFDRLLVAQAAMEGMTLLTTDRIFRKYPVDSLLCGA